MTRAIGRAAVTIVCSFGCAAAAHAQAPVGGFAANLPVPASPAFAALGVSPDKVTRPATPAELATSILNGVDRNGVLQSGLAIDVAPYMAWAGRRIQRSDYANNRLIRFFSRAQFSVATAKAASASDKGTRLAVGTTLTLFDLGDPRMDEELANCIATANRAALASAPPPPPPPVGVVDEAALAKFEAQIEKIQQDREKSFRHTCREEARSRLWNRSALVVGVAPTFYSGAGDVQDLRASRTSAWASVAYGFEHVPGLESASQIIGFVEVRGRDHAAGTRWRFGSGTTAVSVEAVRFSRKDSGVADPRWSVAFSGQRKVADDWWITLAVGGESNAGENGSHTFVLNSLSWGYGQK